MSVKTSWPQPFANKAFKLGASMLYIGILPPIMENQMEKNMENEMETGLI